MWQPWTGDEPETDPPVRIVVDGETFDVVARRDRPGHYHLAWVSGPDPHYGFSTSTSDGSTMTDADIEASVRNFLAQVDPDTGHIE